MNTFRIALAQINTTVGDFEGNTTKIIQSVKRARELKVDLVAFPELTICGYPPEDLILKTHFVKENLRQLKRIRSVTSKPQTIREYSTWLFVITSLANLSVLKGTVLFPS